MSRALNDLTPTMRRFAVELIASCAENGIALMIVDTLRTPAEQAANIAAGVSWTKNSKHLPGPDGKSRAIDIAPYEVYQLHGPDKLKWDGADPAWQQIADIASKVATTLGLTIRRGIDWQQKDYGHYEIVL